MTTRKHAPDGEFCQLCVDTNVAEWKDHDHYAIPVVYGDNFRNEKPRPTSRRMHRPRRCSSHRYKIGGKKVRRIFGMSE